MRKVVYPGTFDPITKGHQDLIERAACIFDKVIVAIAKDTLKKTAFSVEQRLNMVKQVVAPLKNVSVGSFSGLLIHFANAHQAKIILRGLRAVSDFEYEFQLASMNRKLAPEIETIFLTPNEQYTYISSSLIREIASLNGDVSAFVSPQVEKELKTLFGK